MSGRKIKLIWKLAAGVAAAMVLLTGYLWRESRSSGIAVPARVAAPTTDSPSLDPRSHAPLTSTVSRPKPPANATAETGAEICGIGRLPPSVDPADINDYVFAKTRAGRDRWEAALLNSSDLHARAVGLTLQSRHVPGSQESAVAAAEARDELVQLAAGGNDPVVYSLAIGVCRWYQAHPAVSIADAPDGDTGTTARGEDNPGATLRSDTAPNPELTANPGACTRISLSQWARRDPDNAAPWLALAQAARAAGDATSEASDLEQAAQAHKIENSGELLLSLARSEMPQDLSPLERSAAAIDFIGYEAASAGPFGELERYCTAGAIQQAHVRTQCDALATLMVDRGPSLLEFSVGRHLGERVGWSQQRLGELSRERAALFELVPGLGSNPWSCETVSRENAFFEKRMELGEMQALRYFKQKSP